MNPILIFGASTRAAAFSAIRAGLDPICGDMFADADLRPWASTIDVPRFPLGLADAVGHLSAMPFLYTGALENSPQEIVRLSQRHILWGNGPDSLRLCRDPWFCRDILRQAELPALDLCASASPPPLDGRWMLKPRRSAAGRAIAVWNGETKAIHEPHYFQQRALGTSLAAAFVAGPDSVELLGISRQLIGLAELNAPEFGYCGSVFPWNCETALEDMVRRMGSVIAKECRLRGLFGIDMIHDDQTLWLTEVNPRYTASMELIEFSHHQPLIEWHRRVCEEVVRTRRSSSRWEGEAPAEPLGLAKSNDARGSAGASPSHQADAECAPASSSNSQGEFCAKVILYANRHAQAPDLSGRIPRSISLGQLPELADIPVMGTEIQPGQPVFTCMGQGLDPDKLVEELTTRAQELWAKFQ